MIIAQKDIKDDSTNIPYPPDNLKDIISRNAAIENSKQLQPYIIEKSDESSFIVPWELPRMKKSGMCA